MLNLIECSKITSGSPLWVTLEEYAAQSAAWILVRTIYSTNTEYAGGYLHETCAQSGDD